MDDTSSGLIESFVVGLTSGCGINEVVLAAFIKTSGAMFCLNNIISTDWNP